MRSAIEDTSGRPQVGSGMLILEQAAMINAIDSMAVTDPNRPESFTKLAALQRHILETRVLEAELALHELTIDL